MRKKAIQSEGLIEPAVRQRLLAGARELFAHKGYAATTVREIVQAAGVTKPALYYYFQNKEGIFLELMREAGARFESLLAEARKELGSVRERTLHLAERIYRLFLDQIEIARIGLTIHYGPTQGAPLVDFEVLHRKFRELIEQLVREGIGKGEFQNRNAKEMTWAILGAINIAIEVQLWHPELPIGNRGLVRILDVIFEGISKKDYEEKGEKKYETGT
ncbi:MAG: TetR/AcrR family transcriptional regulator [Thermodesulfobacteriota bacterium]